MNGTKHIVAVYAPRHGNQSEIIRDVETVGNDTWRVTGEDWREWN